MTDTITTPRLSLKDIDGSPTLSETQIMIGWLKNPEVVRYSEQRHQTHDINSQLTYCCSFKWPSQLRIIYWIEDPIGTISAHVDTNNSVADIGIMIGDTQVWGEGFGTEAWIGLMGHLFEMGIRKIEAGCMDLNRAMVGIFKKSGMTKEGMRKDHFLYEGKPANFEQWSKFKDG